MGAVEKLGFPVGYKYITVSDLKCKHGIRRGGCTAEGGLEWRGIKPGGGDRGAALLKVS